ncbi:lysine-sensitive aspartokinase 3 [Bowmanella dokdonensis]|uniref:Aspartokinase n=1 Tax=Bowmanella dokdonensis TaxID=751969 RepID=A0A939DM75_9ALTE|nr:lysine-sensitive aspartokinase 3 [Bowmanella dokdonensis]MBN7825334.1 lysine-sensitive aspartokinase 3 [Bowmanella dokdonensis]
MSLNIAKFGGTSVANIDAMRSCAKIVIGNPATRMVVVSAAAGVTNHLVQLANEELTSEQVNELIAKVESIEFAILVGLQSPPHVTVKLNELLSILRDLAFHEELLHRPDLKDDLLSLGERMSSLLFAELLCQMGHSAENFDARKVIKTDNEFGQAEPDIAQIALQADKLVRPELERVVLVTQGFIGSDEQDNTTTLGRGGSDYTAALLAEALDAATCEIWTDVIGVYTTDPRITDKAKPLPELSFEEAAEMATFGAKVLHPATMVPAVRKNIRVFVGSSREPEKGGTWIAKDCKVEPHYRALTRRKEQVLVTVKTPSMLYASGFLQQVFEILARHHLSVDLVTTSEIAVSLTIDNPPNSVRARLNRETIEELKEISEVKVEEGYDLVTVVGNNMHSAAGVSSHIFAAIKDYNLRLICYGANPHNISFLVRESDSTEIIKLLHRELFEQEPLQSHHANHG